MAKPGVLHLHRDVATVLGLGAVHLREGRRGDGRLVDAGERLLARHAELLAETRVHVLEGTEGRLVRQHRQRLHVRLGDPGVPCAALQRGDELRSLVVDAAVLFRQGQALGRDLLVDALLRSLALGGADGAHLVERRVRLLALVEQRHGEHGAPHPQAHVRGRLRLSGGRGSRGGGWGVVSCGGGWGVIAGRHVEVRVVRVRGNGDEVKDDEGRLDERRRLSRSDGHAPHAMHFVPGFDRNCIRPTARVIRHSVNSLKLQRSHITTRDAARARRPSGAERCARRRSIPARCEERLLRSSRRVRFWASPSRVTPRRRGTLTR